jgi:3-methyladenine DNA glycosylase Tag
MNISFNWFKKTPEVKEVRSSPLERKIKDLKEVFSKGELLELKLTKSGISYIVVIYNSEIYTAAWNRFLKPKVLSSSLSNYLAWEQVTKGVFPTVFRRVLRAKEILND